jgi:hypothetical protein
VISNIDIDFTDQTPNKSNTWSSYKGSEKQLKEYDHDNDRIISSEMAMKPGISRKDSSSTMVLDVPSRKDQKILDMRRGRSQKTFRKSEFLTSRGKD